MVAAIEMGMAKPQDVLTRLEEEKVRYVLLCDGDPLVERIARDRPDGLFAALLKHDIPG